MKGGDNVVVFIMPQRIQKQRLKVMKTAALKHRLTLVEEFR
jgi:hypothetical protein